MKERLTVRMVLDLANKHYQVNPEKIGRDVYTTDYVYKLVKRKKLKNHGPRHMALFDEDEVRKVLRLY